MECLHERKYRNISGNEQCVECGSVPRGGCEPVKAWRGCGATMGYLSSPLICGIHDKCERCREWTGDAPSKAALARRRDALVTWMREELVGLALSEADVLGATERSYTDFYWWALDRVRTRNGLHGGHFRDSLGEKPRPELVRVRRDPDPSFENIVALAPVVQ